MKKVFTYLIIFVSALVLMTGILLLSTKVPKASIEKNMKSSAQLVCENQVFFRMVEGVNPSMMDRYADSILLNISWSLEDEDALKSVMWTSYHYKAGQNENENFWEAVEEKAEANQQYMRYWHGSAAIVRFLHLFLDLRGIYIFNAVILALLTIALLFILIKNSLYGPAIGLIGALIGVSVWFVPFCLEYTWTFILMLIFSIIIVKAELKKAYGITGYIFLISGILTNYLDFLTTETLTLLVPLILGLYIRLIVNKEPIKEGRKAALLSSLSWAVGYVITWISKWVLAAIILGENTLPYISEHVGERLGRNYGVSPLRFITGAVTNNLSCLFPFSYGSLGIIAGIALLIVLIYRVYVYGRKIENPKAILLLLALGFLPYVRYLILRNHSFLHYFFAYRAQAATILALLILVYEKTTPQRSH